MIYLFSSPTPVTNPSSSPRAGDHCGPFSTSPGRSKIRLRQSLPGRKKVVQHPLLHSAHRNGGLYAMLNPGQVTREVRQVPSAWKRGSGSGPAFLSLPVGMTILSPLTRGLRNSVRISGSTLLRRIFRLFHSRNAKCVPGKALFQAPDTLIMLPLLSTFFPVMWLKIRNILQLVQQDEKGGPPIGDPPEIQRSIRDQKESKKIKAFLTENPICLPSVGESTEGLLPASPRHSSVSCAWARPGSNNSCKRSVGE